MARTRKFIESWYDRLLNERIKNRFEELIIILGLSGFAIHLILIILKDFGYLEGARADILGSPISAIYTPFSFILVYEVFLLIYHLPNSFSVSIAKEYEIISLILVRSIFKDISKLDNTKKWFLSDYNLVLAVDMVGFILLFFLIYLFYRQMEKRIKMPVSPEVKNFITVKKGLAALMVPTLAVLIVYSLTKWIVEIYEYNKGVLPELTDVNKVFYDEFFTVLIMVDVFILIFSLRYTIQYSQLIRNTGFVISTILIRLSFVAEGIFDIVLVVGGVTFGLLMLLIYNQLARVEQSDQPKEESPTD